MSERWVVKNEETLKELYDNLLGRIKEKPYQVDIKIWKEKRSLDANGLYWIWLEEMAAKFTTTKHAFSKDEMHDLMRHKFLGYQDAKQIGKTYIPQQLKTTTGLNTSEFCFYLSNIDAWAAENGCLLSRPEDSHYQIWMDQVENQT